MHLIIKFFTCGTQKAVKLTKVEFYGFVEMNLHWRAICHDQHTALLG